MCLKFHLTWQPCFAQEGNRGAEQVSPFSIASCQIPGHQFFVICSINTLVVEAWLATTLDQVHEVLNKNQVAMRIKTSLLLNGFILQSKCDIFSNHLGCISSPHFVARCPDTFLAFVPFSPTRMPPQGLSVSPTRSKWAIIPKEQLVDISGRPTMLCFNL